MAKERRGFTGVPPGWRRWSRNDRGEKGGTGRVPPPVCPPSPRVSPRGLSVTPLPPVRTRELLALAFPAAASALLNNAFRVIDQLAAGSVSTPAQAAIGSCTFVLIAAYALHLFVAGGVGPLAARAVGAGDRELARKVLGNALLGSVGTWAVVAVVLGGGASAIAALLGLTGDTAVQAATFLQVIGVLGLPLAVAPTLDAWFVAHGQTGRMMVLQLSAAVLNAALNPWFIHHLGLGVAGAALATVVARVPATAVGLWLALRPHGAALGRDHTLRRITHIGGPISVNTLAYAVVYFFVLRTAVSPLGPVVNAALGIGFSALEGVSYPCFLGLSLAVSSVVGRRLGAGQPEEARRAARVALPVMTAIGVGAGLIFWFGARLLCAPFTHDPAVLDAAVGYARALAWSQPAVAWEALAEGVLLGAGASRAVFWFSAPVNALRVPGAWLAAGPLGFGAAGVWWTVNLTSFLKAGLKGAMAARGAWDRTRI